MFASFMLLTTTLIPVPCDRSTYETEESPLGRDVGHAEVVVAIEDDRGTADRPRPLPVRAIVTAVDGSHPDGSGHGTYADGRFFAEGRFEVEVPPGTTSIALRSGPNYEPLDVKVEARAGVRTSVQARLHRWFAPEDQGWYAGDNHVHAQHDSTAAVRTDLAYTALQARADGLDYLTEAGSNVDYADLERLSTSEFLFRFAPRSVPARSSVT